jgi:hypothetical protein
MKRENKKLLAEFTRLLRAIFEFLSELLHFLSNSEGELPLLLHLNIIIPHLWTIYTFREVAIMKKKIKLSLKIINVVLATVSLYLQWSIYKSEKQ